jgi:hypothetical protein
MWPQTLASGTLWIHCQLDVWEPDEGSSRDSKRQQAMLVVAQQLPRVPPVNPKREVSMQSEVLKLRVDADEKRRIMNAAQNAGISASERTAGEARKIKLEKISAS